MSDAYIVSGRRTPVGVRGGWFAGTEIADLAAPVIQTVLSDADVSHTAVDAVIMGNALYGGGNPARVAALAADLPECVPALTVDSQCCAGLDAIALARSLIVSRRPMLSSPAASKAIAVHRSDNDGPARPQNSRSNTRDRPSPLGRTGTRTC